MYLIFTSVYKSVFFNGSAKHYSIMKQRGSLVWPANEHISAGIEKWRAELVIAHSSGGENNHREMFGLTIINRGEMHVLPPVQTELQKVLMKEQTIIKYLNFWGKCKDKPNIVIINRLKLKYPTSLHKMLYTLFCKQFQASISLFLYNKCPQLLSSIPKTYTLRHSRH